MVMTSIPWWILRINDCLISVERCAEPLLVVDTSAPGVLVFAHVSVPDKLDKWQLMKHVLVSYSPAELLVPMKSRECLWSTSRRRRPTERFSWSVDLGRVRSACI